MRSRRNLLPVTMLGLLAAGCGGEKEARQYAAELAAILQNYQASVQKHMQEQQTAYEKLAHELDKAEQKDSRGNSDLEREQRVVALADQLLSDSPAQAAAFTRTRLREALEPYAATESAKNREMVTRDLDAYRRFLTGIQDLEKEAADISQLQKQFVNLSKKSGSLDQIKQLAAFGQDVHGKYEQMLCDGSKSEQTDLQSNLTALDTKIAAASDTDKPALEAAKAKVNADLSKVNARISQLSGCSTNATK